MGQSRITLSLFFSFFLFYLMVCNILYLSLFWLSHNVWFVLKQSKTPKLCRYTFDKIPVTAGCRV